MTAGALPEHSRQRHGATVCVCGTTGFCWHRPASVPPRLPLTSPPPPATLAPPTLLPLLTPPAPPPSPQRCCRQGEGDSGGDGGGGAGDGGGCGQGGARESGPRQAEGRRRAGRRPGVCQGRRLWLWRAPDCFILGFTAPGCRSHALPPASACLAEARPASARLLPQLPPLLPRPAAARRRPTAAPRSAWRRLCRGPGRRLPSWEAAPRVQPRTPGAMSRAPPRKPDRMSRWGA